MARAAWLFKYFGAKNVKILNGGLKKWLLEKKPINIDDSDKLF